MTKSRGIYKRHPFDRLLSRSPVDPDTGCFVWSGSVNHGGYGRIYDIRVRGYVTIHRLAYVHVKGPIPDGLQIDHLCRNTRCVNPDHLEAVTLQENMRRRSAALTHCKRGHEFTEANTYRYGGRRYCRPCARMRYFGRQVVSSKAAELLDH